ncbi:MAG: fumarylacetoacetase [Gemmatimonadaceae bacterium]
MTNATHDPQLRSWVESAQVEETDFPIQNLPFGVFRLRQRYRERWRLGVAIGSHVLDLSAADGLGVLPGVWDGLFGDSLNALMAEPTARWSALRESVSNTLRADTSSGRKAAASATAILVPQADVELRLPVDVGDYTDFYASVYHATNVGSMFRPDSALLPNYKWVPIGYHGRASSIVVSGTPVRRPEGQWSGEPPLPPAFGPTRRLDYEAELGLWIGGGNAMGAPIPVGVAERSLFGACLLNDWSARDIQAWEYQPLGPFLAKNFASTVSPWVVTWEALAPFRAPAFTRAPDDPPPLPYLLDDADQRDGGLDIRIDVLLRSAVMRDQGMPAARLSSGATTDLYWTPAQMVAHHTAGGCNLRPGDLLGSGTVSGQSKDSRGCLLELTWRGSEPVQLPSGEVRRFLEDGDEVIMRARCEAAGYRSIGFGDCSGLVLPAQA